MKKAIVFLTMCAVLFASGICAFAQTDESADVFTADVAETADISSDEDLTSASAAQAADKQSPATGVEGIALVAGAAIAAGGIMLVATKKR